MTIAFLLTVLLPAIGSVLFILNELRRLIAKKRAARKAAGKTRDPLDWDTKGIV